MVFRVREPENRGASLQCPDCGKRFWSGIARQPGSHVDLALNYIWPHPWDHTFVLGVPEIGTERGDLYLRRAGVL